MVVSAFAPTIDNVLAQRNTKAVLPDGDFSPAQLDRAQRQTIALRDYYTLRAAAIRRHLETGQLYETVQLAKEAAGGLGYESINERVVRLWHAEYLAGNGTLTN